MSQSKHSFLMLTGLLIFALAFIPADQSLAQKGNYSRHNPAS
jgi:hypothetical protein